MVSDTIPLSLPQNDMVLILVLMEDGLGQQVFCLMIHGYVLILVLMEDGLGLTVTIKAFYKDSGS